jgi:hypothetical protein
MVKKLHPMGMAGVGMRMQNPYPHTHTDPLCYLIRTFIVIFKFLWTYEVDEFELYIGMFLCNLCLVVMLYSFIYVGLY